MATALPLQPGPLQHRPGWPPSFGCRGGALWHQRHLPHEYLCVPPPFTLLHPHCSCVPHHLLNPGATVTSSPELPVTVCPKVCVSYSLERGGWPWLLQASWALLGWVQAVGRMRLRLAPLILALRLREQHVGGLFSWWTSGRWRAGGHPGCTSAVSPITHWTKQNKSRGWGGVLPLQRKGRVGGSSCSRSKKMQGRRDLT